MRTRTQSADIAAVTPMVCEVLRDGMTPHDTSERRALIRNALVVLARQSGELALGVAREYRSRFDAKVLPGADPMSRTSRLEALGKLGLGSEAQLAAFKAFGPALLHITPDIYQHANNLLIERGILADFKALYGRPVARAVSPRAPTVSVPTDEGALASILDRLLSGSKLAL